MYFSKNTFYNLKKSIIYGKKVTTNDFDSLEC